MVCYMMMSVAATGSHRLMAQELSVEYTTEMQTDFRKAANWVNLLRTDFSQPIADGLCINLATISIARSRASASSPIMPAFLMARSGRWR